MGPQNLSPCLSCRELLSIQGDQMLVIQAQLDSVKIFWCYHTVWLSFVPLPVFSAGLSCRATPRAHSFGSGKAVWRPRWRWGRRGWIRRFENWRISIWPTREKIRWRPDEIREGRSPKEVINYRILQAKLEH